MLETFTDYILADISSPITLLLLLIMLIYFVTKVVFKNWGNIKSYFEAAYQRRKKREELYETVRCLEKAKNDIVAETQVMNKTQQDFYDMYSKHKDQSQQLRDRLEEKTNEAVKKSEEANNRSKETLNEIKELHLMLEEIKNRQEEINADRKAQKVNELRKDLIEAYQHFALLENNPAQTWNEMEAHAFWSMFADYERYGGNDFAHRVIQPAMNKLKVLSITQEE